MIGRNGMLYNNDIYIPVVNVDYVKLYLKDTVVVLSSILHRRLTLKIYLLTIRLSTYYNNKKVWENMFRDITYFYFDG